MTRNIGQTNKATVKRAEDLRRFESGTFRTGGAIKAGVHPRTLYTLLAVWQATSERLIRNMPKT
ncbi:MAG: hypothetical protein KKC25_00910 [Proteobacteria bacterium]|nr:hypothetical protein [Pseudomonadota bacterium]MBU2261978.1 hypothetical protein [Pseudomonadota bacterium]